jgi:hypothetical protein
MGKVAPLYQHYAAIHYRTCERCLGRHGEIFTDLSLTPPLHEGCRCTHLEFSPDERDYYEEKAKRMRAKAAQELQRRQLWQHGRQLLMASSPEALRPLQQAAEIEVYLEEIEKLCQDLSYLASHPDLSKKLRDIFIYGYQNKFTREKYAPVPEGMRWALESGGMQRIKELFHGLIAL